MANYSFFTLRRLLRAMGFRVERQLGFGFPLPALEPLGPLVLRCFPRWAAHIAMRARRVDMPSYAVKWVPCPRVHGQELALPGDRCLCPHPHVHACLACEYFHLNWLHPRDPRRRTALRALADAGRELPSERQSPLCWRRTWP